MTGVQTCALPILERRSQIDYRAHTPGQLVNHIPNNDCISTKLGLLLTLREKYCRVPPSCTVRKSTPWLPETYQLDSPADVTAMFEVENQLSQEKYNRINARRLLENAENEVPPSSLKGNSAHNIVEEGSGENGNMNHQGQSKEIGTEKGKVVKKDNKFDEAKDGDGGCLWIYKPSCNNRGRGIKVLKGKESLSLICYGKSTNDPLTTILPSAGILQRYIENPLLVGAEQLKFDVRCYMLVARNEDRKSVV